MSHEVVGDPAACVLDGLTIVRGDLVKVFGWYDNAQRTVDLVDMIVAPFQTVRADQRRWLAICTPAMQAWKGPSDLVTARTRDESEFMRTIVVGGLSSERHFRSFPAFRPPNPRWHQMAVRLELYSGDTR